MAARLILPLVAAALVVGGCGSDGNGPAAAADEKKTTTAEAASATESAPAETVAPEKSLRERRPAADEIRWVGRVAQSLYAVVEPMEIAASAFPQLARGRPLKPRERRVVVRALAAVSGCTKTFERLAGDAPSVRLEDVADALRDACESYESGAADAAKLARGATDQGALERWEGSWTNAIRIVVNASDIFGDFQPGNLRKLRTERGKSTKSRVEPTFSAVSTTVTPAGGLFLNDHQVRCWSKRDWPRLLREMTAWSGERVTKDTQGFVGYVGDHRINLAPEICDALVALRYEGARPTTPPDLQVAAFAVGVLTHEGEHARGVASEAAATCYGMQRIRQVARKLGADAEYAELLAETFWSDIYPEAPPGYSSSGCRPRGPLDVYRKRAAWP